MIVLLESSQCSRVIWSVSCEAHGKGAKDGIADTVQYKSTGRILNEKLVMPLMYALVLTLYNLVYNTCMYLYVISKSVF